ALEKLGVSFVGQIMNRNYTPPCRRVEQPRKKIVGAEEDVAADGLHPEEVGGGGELPREPRDATLSAQVERAHVRVGRKVRVETRPFVGDPCVAEQVEIDVTLRQ